MNKQDTRIHARRTRRSNAAGCRGIGGARRRGWLVALAAAVLSIAVAGPSGRGAALRAGLFPAAEAATAAPAVAVGQPAPEVVFTTVDGHQRRLSEFKGRPVMLWLFATWCPTCVSGTASMAENFATLRASGLQIVQLRLYQNLGYAGPTVEEIAKRNAGEVYPSPHWLFGDASRETSYRYDPKGFPDRYFLIDRDGIVRHVGWAPGATMDAIRTFAQGGAAQAQAAD